MWTMQHANDPKHAVNPLGDSLQIQGAELEFLNVHVKAQSLYPVEMRIDVLSH